MKKIKSICFLLMMFTIHPVFASDIVIFNENFETDSSRSRWINDFINGSINWRFQNGGYATYPLNAHNGKYNALFQLQSTNKEASYLISPSLNLVSPRRYNLELRFSHAQWAWNGRLDTMAVYYRKAKKPSPYVRLAKYTQEYKTWTREVILLPDSIYTSDFYIAFKGTTNWGYGVCLDSVQIVETSVVQRSVGSINFTQPETGYIGTGTSLNILGKMYIEVLGNNGDMILNQITFNSQNSSDADVANNGVRLYYTKEDLFDNINPIGQTSSFNNGNVLLNNINKNLPSGKNYIWVTAEIKSDANPGNLIDLQLLPNSVKLNNDYYPQTTLSPVGSRIIYKTIFKDDFETNNGWKFKPEFEREIPLGKGGSDGLSPDPSRAYSGSYIIGSDLTGLGLFAGDYELLQYGDTLYYAMSPLLDLTYYKDIKLSFKRWLNVGDKCNAGIQLSNNGGESWNSYWKSNNAIINDNHWTQTEYNINNYMQKKQAGRLMFSMGMNLNQTAYSGWNIDDVLITGTFINNDVGVTKLIAPLSGSIKSSNETIAVEVTNFGGGSSPTNIPVYYTFDNNIRYYDTIKTSIPFQGKDTLYFKQKYNLSEGGFYTIQTGTLLINDEYSQNNYRNDNILVLPLLPISYDQNFENGTSFWFSYGTNNSWEKGSPNKTKIKSAASGNNAWVTTLYDNYNNDEDSYVESPCFNFTGITNPVLELKTNRDLETDKDGAYVRYSIDCGKNWKDIDSYGNKYDTLWNWYNSSVIGTPAFAGWTGTSAGWVTSRKLLPTEISNKGCVQFRVHLKSDANNTQEGFAFDDVKLFEAPPDVGVIRIVSPVSACELSKSTSVTIRIKNFGIDTLPINYLIPIGLKVNNNAVVLDTLKLSAKLPVGDSITYTIKKPVNLWMAGDYTIKAFTKVTSDINIYTAANNDTARKTVSVYGLPQYTLGPDIGSSAPATVVLDAGSGYTSYLWNDVTSGRNYSVPGIGTYWVAVTNASGCYGRDTIVVRLRTTDLQITSADNLISQCKYDTLAFPYIVIKNNGPNTVTSGSQFTVAYTVNGLDLQSQTITLGSNLIQDNTITFKFTKKVDISIPGTYTFRMFVNYIGDPNLNDTLIKTIDVYGLPTVNIGTDTIKTSRADTITFDAGVGFSSYQWQDNSTAQTFAVASKASQKYKVTVTALHGCGTASDSAIIQAYDIGVNKFVSPVSSCVLGKNENVSFSVKNFGSDILPLSTPISLQVSIKGNDSSITFNTSKILNPGDSDIYTLVKKFDFSTFGNYNLSAKTIWNKDINASNNETRVTVGVYGYPVFNLGPDTIITSTPTSIVLKTAPGYASYKWQDGDTLENYTINYQGSRKYKVTVANSFGCTSKDSIQIINRDFGVVSILAPSTGCGIANSFPKVSFANYSYDTLKIGEKVKIGFKVNSLSPVEEYHTLTDTMFPGEEVIHTFATLANVSTLGTYKLIAYTSSLLDGTRNNDTAKSTIINRPVPFINLGPETIYTTRPETLLFDAGVGFKSYTWQNGASTQTFQVNDGLTRKYKVSAPDINNCGVYSDSVMVITFNVGIDKILGIQSTCSLTNSEHVSVEVKNYGQDAIVSGTILGLKCWLNNIEFYNGNYTLAANLNGGSAVKIDLSPSLNLSSVGTYTIKAQMSLTLNAGVSVTKEISVSNYGYPLIDLGGDIYSLYPESIVLDPGGTGYTYLWSDGSKGTTLHIKDKNSKLYSVTATNAYGCSSSDDVNIFVTDISISNITSPESNCYLSSNEKIKFSINNLCADTIKTGEIIGINCTINGKSKTDNIVLNAPLLPGKSVNVTTNESFDFSVKNSYYIALKVIYNKDINQENDQTNKTVVVSGLSRVNLGSKLRFTGKADSIILSAGNNFATYQWQDGSTGNSFAIKSIYPAKYWVKVSDIYGCTDFDSVEIVSYDLKIEAVNLPENSCNLSANESVSLKVENNGSLAIPQGSIVNIETSVNDSKSNSVVELPKSLSSGETILMNYPTGLDFSGKGKYNVKLSATIDYDYNNSNQLAEGEVEVYSTPVVNFAGIENNATSTELPYTISLTNDFSSYKWQDNSTEKTFNVQESGQYTVIVTNEYQCSATGSVSVTVIPKTDPDPDPDPTTIVKTDGSNITIFPNPADHFIYVTNSTVDKMVTIELTNISGSQVLLKHNVNNNALIKLDVSGIASGAYLLKLTNSKGCMVNKVMINRK
jgi:hypothetical protein